MSATVRDVMTTKVIAVREEADYTEIVTALRRFLVSACPVIDDSGAVTGVVSEADLLQKQTDPALPAGLIRLSWRLSEQTKATAVTAKQLMTSPAICIRADEQVCQAARLMQERQVKRLPVVDPGGRLVGIVSRCDVLSVFDRHDADIAEETAKIIVGELGAGAGDLDVTVISGIVTVTGLVRRREDAVRLLARIRHADGVVAVRNRLNYPAATKFANR
jgi:CBS domain-containing protein